VLVPVMQIGIVRVAVHQAPVAMEVAVGLAAVQAGIVFVLMMLVVHVDMGMLDRPVDVPVLVPLGHMEPYAERHQRRGDPEQRRGLLA
jgi:hypothetical protein